MKMRRINSDGEPQYGQGKQDFKQGIDAVAQAIQTRLKLFYGEWWEDTTDGLPLWTDIIGFGGSNKNKVNALITKRILDTKLNETKLISEVTDVVNTYSPTLRKYTYSSKAKSIYGTITISNGS
jgi:hypothetical protein